MQIDAIDLFQHHVWPQTLWAKYLVPVLLYSFLVVLLYVGLPFLQLSVVFSLFLVEVMCRCGDWFAKHFDSAYKTQSPVSHSPSHSYFEPLWPPTWLQLSWCTNSAYSAGCIKTLVSNIKFRSYRKYPCYLPFDRRPIFVVLNSIIHSFSLAWS